MPLGDFHTLQASASLTSSGYTTTRSATQTVASPAANTLVLGASLTDPFVFAIDVSAVRTRFEALIPFNNDYTRLYTAGFFQQSGNTRRDFVITSTAATTPISTGNRGVNAELKAPIFTNAQGFDSLWESRNSMAANYVVSSTGWTATSGVSAPLADGVVTRSWSRFGPVPP